MSTHSLSSTTKTLSLCSLNEETQERSKRQPGTAEAFHRHTAQERVSSTGLFTEETGSDVADIAMQHRGVRLYPDRDFTEETGSDAAEIAPRLEAASFDPAGSKVGLPLAGPSPDDENLSGIASGGVDPEVPAKRHGVTDEYNTPLGAEGYGDVHESEKADIESEQPVVAEIDVGELMKSLKDEESKADEHTFKDVLKRVKSHLKDNFVNMFGDNPAFIPWITGDFQSEIPGDIEGKKKAFIDICIPTLKKVLNTWYTLAKPLEGTLGDKVQRLNQLIREEKKQEEGNKKSKTKSLWGGVKKKFGVKVETLEEKINRKKEEIDKVNRAIEQSGFMPLRFSLNPVLCQFLLDSYAVRDFNVAIKLFRVECEGEIRLHVIAGADLKIIMRDQQYADLEEVTLDVKVPDIDLYFYGASAEHLLRHVELGALLNSMPSIIWDFVKKKVRIRPKKKHPEDQQYKASIIVREAKASLRLANSTQNLNIVINDFNLEALSSDIDKTFKGDLKKTLVECPSSMIVFVSYLCDLLGSKLTESKNFINQNQFQRIQLVRRTDALLNIIPAMLSDIRRLSQHCSVNRFRLLSSGTHFSADRSKKSDGYNIKVDHPELTLYANHTKEDDEIKATMKGLSYSTKRLDRIDIVDFTSNARASGEVKTWPIIRKSLEKSHFEHLEFKCSGYMFSNIILMVADLWKHLIDEVDDLNTLMRRFSRGERSAMYSQACHSIDFLKFVWSSLAFFPSENRSMDMILGPFDCESVIGFFKEKRGPKDPRHRFYWAQATLKNTHIEQFDATQRRSFSCETIKGEWQTRPETIQYWWWWVSHCEPVFGEMKKCNIKWGDGEGKDEEVLIERVLMNDARIEEYVFHNPEGGEINAEESNDESGEKLVLTTLRDAHPLIFKGLASWVETLRM